jgi:hypothetical protein
VDLKDLITMRTYLENYFPLLLLMITVLIGYLTHIRAHIPNGCTSTLQMKAAYSSKMYLPSGHMMSQYRRQQFMYIEGTGALAIDKVILYV